MFSFLDVPIILKVILTLHGIFKTVCGEKKKSVSYITAY